MRANGIGGDDRSGRWSDDGHGLLPQRRPMRDRMNMTTTTRPTR
jgi:hypothetical protein